MTRERLTSLKAIRERVAENPGVTAAAQDRAVLLGLLDEAVELLTGLAWNSTDNRGRDSARAFLLRLGRDQ